jgi:hypothetical protein
MAITRITTTVLESNAISGQKLANLSVTEAKIAVGAVTGDKLAANAVSAGAIGDNLVRVYANINLVNSNVTTEAANVAKFYDATTDLNFGTGKYYFDKSASSLGIANTPTAFSTAPDNTVVIGTPANVMIRATGGSGVAKGGNVILGTDLSSTTTAHTLDVTTGSTNLQDVTAQDINAQDISGTGIDITNTGGRAVSITTNVQTIDDPLRIVNSSTAGNVFIGYRNTDGTDTTYRGGLYEPDSSFRIEYRSGTSGAYNPYFSILPTTHVGIGTAAPDANLHVIGTGHITGEVNLDDDLIVTGNLTVHGESATVNAQNSTFSDQFIALASNLAHDGAVTADQGIFINRGTAGNAIIYYDQSATGFKLAETRDRYSNVNIKPTHAANLHLANAFVETLHLNGTEITTTGTVINDILRRNGSLGLSSDWDAGSHQIRAETFQSDVSTGTAPLTVASTTVVTNLNADLLDGVQGGAYDTKSNVSATYIQLNSNINVVQDNVDALSGTNLSPGTNVITSVAGANAYGIGGAVTQIVRTRVTLDGILQTPTVEYVIPSSGVMQLTDVQTSIPAGLTIVIQRWT